MKLNKEQKRTQISSSHRLIEMTKRIRHRLNIEEVHGKDFEYIDRDYFYNWIIPELHHKFNTSISKRQTALIKRIRDKKANYEVNRLTAYEYAAEAFFDNYFFKNNNSYVTPKYTVDLIKESIECSNKICLVMPILSRKPISPIKNKGYFPDLGEINTLLRFAKIAKIIRNISGFKCEFLVLADGNKYNRACGTPKSIVDDYQMSLNYWINILNISDVVKICDYEKWILENKEINYADIRESMYINNYNYLSKKFDPIFCCDDLTSALEKIKHANDLGNQINYTYWSILTSVHYNSLYSAMNYKDIYHDREVQNLYISFISSLSEPISRIKKSHLFSYENIGVKSSYAPTLIKEMRFEAWQAAKRYVAISLTDRKLNTIYDKLPIAIKLTIHGKQNEFNFISSTQRDFSKTAQHTVGGIRKIKGDISVDYKYRLERECRNEKKIYINPFSTNKSDSFDPLYEMSLLKQPIYYLSNE
ncbi:L-tyrosine/L-tryptophan isonitrile synthase family protein [Xenorhabdus sp. PR6a]|uniref:L-tyrosine/L-tryptophan isonitrile synthase family protein n=1 Tax=Xenorhabdus sp. PR6a TaxID=3025877 RepID=UPI002358976D|nr:L-tyrosine/L-tryptophan isonitrile synthase family protein [Xenorhabdus sp. PR6a]MDC9583227.1 L-tyrosine/L-tryptophan isonitrile synthase family protein [Xenorhabdus sp. PR6a]